MINWNINIDPLTEQPTDKEFLQAFYRDKKSKVYLRSFDDKQIDKHGKNMEVQLSNYDSIISTLKKYNSGNYGIYFVVNGGGQDDRSVIKHGTCQAQFMEIDDFKMEDQIQIINAFPLKPSIIVKTRKSLHTYWLLNDGDINRFREIQNRLVKLFGSDPVIVNESRVMRLPNYYHHKQDPVMVQVIHFDPELRYKQSELIDVLDNITLKQLLDDTEISDAEKDNILALINNKQSKQRKDNNKIVNLDDGLIHEHSRVNTLVRIISRLKKSGLDDDEIIDKIKDINQNKCTPPLSDKQLAAEVLPAITRWENLSVFHKWSKPNKDGDRYPYDVIDNNIAEDIIEKYNLFVLFGKLYCYRNGLYILDDDGSIIKGIISKYIYDELITDVRLTRIYRLILSKDDIHIKLSDVNNYPSTWIPFKNGMLDVLNYNLHPHDPKYNSINIIPHEWNKDCIEKDTVVNDFINGIIPDKDDRLMFLEYIGYCLTKATDQQKFLIIKGDGGLGKSVLLTLTQKVMGDDNYTSLTLQNLNDRFSPAFLMGKLMNIYADLPSTDMSEINGIKTITGEDVIRAEYKGGNVFQFKPYCKLLYSANRIPKSRDDRTTAYYRRMLIISVKQRAAEIPDLENRLDKSIDVFIHLVVNALHDMYIKYSGKIQVSKNCETEVNELYKETDTVHAWLCDYNYQKSTNLYEERKELYSRYKKYCENTDRVRGMLSANGFYSSLRDRGFKEYKSGGIYKFYIEQQVSIDSNDLPFKE